MDNKLDMENAKVSLESIRSTLSLVMEDLEDQHNKTKGHEALFYSRSGTLYIPILDLILCSVNDLIDRM